MIVVLASWYSIWYPGTVSFARERKSLQYVVLLVEPQLPYYCTDIGRVLVLSLFSMLLRVTAGAGRRLSTLAAREPARLTTAAGQRLQRIRKQLSSGLGGLSGNLATFTTSGAAINMDEASKSRQAAANMDEGAPTIFDKILSREIPSDVVYEDDHVLAFRDVNPQAPTHVLCIPKNRDGLTQLSKAEERHEEILGKLLLTARKVAELEKLGDGFRIVINDGVEGCQSVYHLHVHVLGGRQMTWPPG